MLLPVFLSGKGADLTHLYSACSYSFPLAPNDFSRRIFRWEVVSRARSKKTSGVFLLCRLQELSTTMDRRLQYTLQYSTGQRSWPCVLSQRTAGIMVLASMLSIHMLQAKPSVIGKEAPFSSPSSHQANP